MSEGQSLWWELPNTSCAFTADCGHRVESGHRYPTIYGSNMTACSPECARMLIEAGSPLAVRVEQAQAALADGSDEAMLAYLKGDGRKLGQDGLAALDALAWLAGGESERAGIEPESGE